LPFPGPPVPGGNINIGTLNANTTITATSGALTITTLGSLATAPNQVIGGNVTIGPAAGNSNVILTAGKPDPLTFVAGTGLVPKAQVLQSGSITINTFGGITVNNAPNPNPNVNFQTFGGDIKFIANSTNGAANGGNLSLGGQIQYVANGGN